MMTETLSFPGLGLSFTLNRVAFTVGSFSVYWYGIFFALGFALGVWYFSAHAKRMGVHPYDGFDVILWAVVGGMVGARLYYVAFQWDYYRDNLSKIFALREGGLAIYGGVLGALLVGYLACRIKKLPFLPMLDAGLPGLMLAQAIGRWGNFFNIEAFGGNTSLPWGMISDSTVAYLTRMQATLAAQGMTVDPLSPVHPTFLYESLWNLIGVLVIVLVLNRRRKYDGEIACFYLAWYGFGRMFIEGLRTDSLMWGSVRVSQALGAILFVLASAVMIAMRVRLRRQASAGSAEGEAAPAATPRLYCETEESRVRIAAVQQKLDAEKAKKAEKKAGKASGATPGAQPAETAHPVAPQLDGSDLPDIPDTDLADAPEESAQVGVIEEEKPSPEDDASDADPLL